MSVWSSQWLDAAYAAWPVLLLLAAWVGVRNIAHRIYRMVTATLDRVYPDTMPQTAGEWVTSVIEARGLGDRLEVHEGGSNALAGDGIYLDDRTHDKRDPFFWAIAAHELGHVRVHHTPGLGHLSRAARGGYGFVSAWVRALVVTNLLFGSVVLQQFAVDVLEVALVLGGLLVLDELVASLFALRTLRVDGELTGKQLAGAACGLLFALLTYVSAVAADYAAWVWFEHIPTSLAGTPVPIVDTSATWMFVTLILLTVAVGFDVIRLVAALALNVTAYMKIPETSKTMLGALFLVMTWNHATTLTGQALFAAALVSVYGAPFKVLSAILGLLLLPLAKASERVSDWVLRTHERAVEAALVSLATLESSWVARIAQAVPLLAVLFYMSWYWAS